jgi:phosphomannomutase/phosphoglucomutase
MNRLFGTNGVRGVVGSTMAPDLAVRLGQAVGTWLPKGARLAVGMDARSTGPHLKAAFCSGVNATGVHTVDIGLLPSPGIQLYVRDRKFAAGAIVTASHNPPEYNGIKLVAPDGTETSQGEEAAVEAIHFGQSFRRVPWQEVGTHSSDGGAVDHYIDAVLSQVDVQAIRRARLKVVLDPGGGAGCVTAPRLMSALGVQAVPLSCQLDGAFRDRPSEPSPPNAKRCMDAVKANRANLGILQDGDADRAIFVDEKGDYVWGDRSLALGALWELKRHPPGSVVCTAVSSSSCVADAVRTAGGRLEWTVVGSPIVAREMLRLGAVFGGEDNGGLMFTRHQVCRDGLMAMAFMLELLARTGRPLSDLLSEIPTYALVKDKVHVPEERKSSILAGYKQALESEGGITSVDDRDGVKAYLADGWVLVRPSGTEPIYRVQAESRDAATAQALADRFKAILAHTVQANPA